MKSLSIQVNKDERIQQGQKVSSKDYFSTNIQDGNTGLHLQVFRGGTHLNRVGSELAFCFLLRYLFCYSWFRLQLIAIHCNRRVVWSEHPRTRLPRTLSSLCTHHTVAQVFARRVCIKHVHPHVITCLSGHCLKSHPKQKRIAQKPENQGNK